MKKRFPKARHTGFTLVELIAVIVIMAILAAVGTQFIISTMRSYRDVEQRSKLVNRGRLVLEQMTRQLRQAVPNATRVSASGNCIEFMPLVAGATYIGNVPDTENFAAVSNTIFTAPFSMNSGNGLHVVIGALTSDEIYATGSPLARADVSSFNNSLPAPSITLTDTHRFVRNSLRQRAFLADDPRRFCLIGSQLYLYSDYGFSTMGLSDLDPGGNASLMAEGVSTSSQAFTLSIGTEDVNTLVALDFRFNRNESTVDLQQEILIRNVP